MRKFDYSSLKWQENGNDYLPFVLNFLSNLYLCYKELDKRFAVVQGKKVNKTSATRRLESRGELIVRLAVKHQFTPLTGRGDSL